jgi:hypothetical protein
MNKSAFYRYDFYALERKYPELKFIEFLDMDSSLNKSIEQFIQDVTNLLYELIIDGKNVEVTEVILPSIEEKLEKFLKDHPLYISYKSHSEQNLSEFVLNKFLQRIFKKDGHNNEIHFIQGYIHSWLEKKLALQIAQDSRFSSLELLKLLIDKTEMLHNFQIYIIENVPSAWILSKKKEWVEVNVSPEKIIDYVRLYGEDYFNNYINSLQTQSKENLWNYVEEITRNADYMMLSHEFSFISSVLIKKDIFLWIEFWDNLKFPVIQDCVFHSFFDFDPQQYLQLVSKLIDEKVALKSDLKILLIIVAKNYFKASYKLTERFSLYEDLERKNGRNEHIFEEGVKQQNKWLEEKKKNYECIIQSVQSKLSNSDIEDWIFSYKPRVNNRQFKPDEIYNSEIKLLTETYKAKAIELLSSGLQSFNLQKFNFYAEIAKEKEDKKLASNLLEAITSFTSSDKFFWDRTYVEPYWSALKGLGFILSKQDDSILKAKGLISKFKTNHQGWNPTKIEFSPLVKESFICSGVVLMFENESAFKDKHEKESFFKELLNHILTQDRYSLVDNHEYYQMPLHLLFLVANQIFSDVKEYYEQELIDNYDNLYSLLAILSNEKIALSDNSKKLIKKRLEKEFLLEKRQFSNRNQKDKVQELEKMVETLNLENKDNH